MSSYLSRLDVIASKIDARQKSRVSVFLKTGDRLEIQLPDVIDLVSRGDHEIQSIEGIPAPGDGLLMQLLTDLI